MPDLDAIFERAHLEADATLTLVDLDGRKRIRAITRMLKDARDDLGKRLGRINNIGGSARSKFDVAQMVAYNTQLLLVQSIITRRLMPIVANAQKRAIPLALRRMMTLTEQVDRIHDIKAVLPIREAIQFSITVNVRQTSAMMESAASVERYGSRAVRQMEGIMQRGILQGSTRERMTRQLQKYTGSRYQALRILRTELARAYNGAAFDGITQMARDDDRARKKILAVMDAKTAPDSIAVHGQVRKVQDLFLDGAGRQYLYPPARPNDREHVIPWRIGWKNTPYTKRMTNADVAQAVEEGIPKRYQGNAAERRMRLAQVGQSQKLVADG